MSVVLQLPLSIAGSGLRRVSAHWMLTRDGDGAAHALFRRHYSARRTPGKIAQFVGPGEKMVLMTEEGDALYVWRREVYRRDGQTGVNCAVFRNESDTLSSVLILEAMGAARSKWPNARLFTHVDAGKVRSSNPGYCFQRAGWHRCGRSGTGLIILEHCP